MLLDVDQEKLENLSFSLQLSLSYENKAKKENEDTLKSIKNNSYYIEPNLTR